MRLYTLLLGASVLGMSLPAVAAVPKENPMVFGNARLSVITPTLLRLEFAKDGKFIDEPTLFAYDRKSMLPMDSIKVTELGDDRYEIVTSALTINYHDDGFPFSTSNLMVYYDLNGKRKKFTNRFLPKNNLGGTVETLDRVTREIPMDDGLLSRDGWYMIDDERSDLLTSDGWIKPRDTNTHIQDQYCFIYGNDYRSALASLGAISGRVPMTRKYIHGVWYCRYWDYTSDEFLDIIRGYDENDFPLDNIVFDMGWHTNDATLGTGHNGHLNWNGYTWNRELIPDPKALIDSVHARGVTVSLNDHPHDGIRPHEHNYAEFAAAMGAKEGEVPLFDLSDRRYMENFFKYAHRPSEDMGVDFWWLDWQQNYLYPHVRGHHSTSLSWINELYYRDSQHGNRRGAGYSRWAGWGDHRHPIQFSGDAQANWEMLAFEVKLTACSGQGGCYYWAHDIGGFRGDPNPELSVRWTQFGALSAALRVHSTKDKRLDRRPWISGEKETKAMRRMYHMRSEMMPYIYSSVWQTHNTMVPLNRSMFIDYGDQKESFSQPQQFTFGDILLAAPISTPGTGADLTASQRVWFPAGEVWYDYFTHEMKQGGHTADISKPLDEFPLYVRGGWVLPMQPYTPRPASAPLDTLVMRVYPAAADVDNTFTLYEDDGISLDYQKGVYATTPLRYTQSGGRATVTVEPVEGSYPGLVKRRAYRLQLPSLQAGARVKVNGKSVKPSFDNNVGCHVVSVAATPLSRRITIEYDIN
ncbi:TIM-barrel domain-containing protein [Muribaculum sp.]|uniref:glycoside hydrolase family 31 protein n=1 Tax=Muribaculum sp. TaxID=1918611 RepID=UPI0023C1C518|nr:TIM-barrel domain-containing protein [Muribaculum sp.]MDE5704737.1 glycoside hydrolase family 31 protein [Muribaculum sp.]